MCNQIGQKLIAAREAYGPGKKGPGGFSRFMPEAIRLTGRSKSTILEYIQFSEHYDWILDRALDRDQPWESKAQVMRELRGHLRLLKAAEGAIDVDAAEVPPEDWRPKESIVRKVRTKVLREARTVSNAPWLEGSRYRNRLLQVIDELDELLTQIAEEHEASDHPAPDTEGLVRELREEYGAIVPPPPEDLGTAGAKNLVATLYPATPEGLQALRSDTENHNSNGADLARYLSQIHREQVKAEDLQSRKRAIREKLGLKEKPVRKSRAAAAKPG
jgi:hypothetical protein